MGEPFHPDTMPADVVAAICEATGLPEADVRRYMAFVAAAQHQGLWERLGAHSESEDLVAAVERRINPRDDRPLPTWAPALLSELGVTEEERARGESLLRRLMALVGRDEDAVRGFLYSEHPSLGMVVAEDIREYGLQALDQLLRDIVT